jgi:hypothetical protein
MKPFPLESRSKVLSQSSRVILPPLSPPRARSQPLAVAVEALEQPAQLGRLLLVGELVLSDFAVAVLVVARREPLPVVAALGGVEPGGVRPHVAAAEDGRCHLDGLELLEPGGAAVHQPGVERRPHEVRREGVVRSSLRRRLRAQPAGGQSDDHDGRAPRAAEKAMSDHVRSFLMAGGPGRGRQVAKVSRTMTTRGVVSMT